MNDAYMYISSCCSLQRPSRRELDEMESRLDILRQLSLSSDYLDESIISEVCSIHFPVSVIGYS